MDRRGTRTFDASAPALGEYVRGRSLARSTAAYHGRGSADQNVEVELGYGMPIGASLGRSIVGLTLDPSGRAYRVGYNLRMGQGLQVSVATTARTMEENGPPPSYGLSARMDLNW